MAEINEAYRVLSDPGRRAIYDRTLTASSTSRPTANTEPPPPDVDGYDVDEYDIEFDPRPSRPSRVLAPDGPARYPWKPMLVVAIVGSALVLVSAALADPPSEEVPDGIIRAGSCVAFEPNGDVREVACTGEDDVVVELRIPADARCPVGMLPHRDRLGLGVACIIP
jgi:molecular chaperone DnaJ